MFFTEEIPLAFTTKPLKDESLVSFILRLTQLNHLKNPTQLLKYFTGSTTKPPTVKHIIRIAELTCCSTSEISQLFGFEWSTNELGLARKINNEYITKPYFISSRYLAYCPKCIEEENYLRSYWEFTFLKACPTHKIYLIDKCPLCHRALTWRRPGVDICTCGGILNTAETSTADDFSLFISSIIVQHVTQNRGITIPNTLPIDITNKLLQLNLDSLFKTLWLFGHTLSYKFKRHKKNNRPCKVINTTEILNKAHSLLSNWPDSFFNSLEYFSEELSKTKSSPLLLQMFGPIHRYITEDMDSNEFLFIQLAYERHIRRTWKLLDKQIPSSISRQLDLPFKDIQ